MGWPRAHFTWLGLRQLSRVFFHLAIFGVLCSSLMVLWAWVMKTQLGDHMDLAQPGDGYLWPASLGLGVAFVAPIHIVGLALKPMLTMNLKSRKTLKSNRFNGKKIE